jgi:ketosteroid isomerase-like protein
MMADMRNRILMTSGLFVGLAACAPVGGVLTDADRATIEADVRAVVDRFADAERARDADAVAAFLDPSFYMYGDGVRADYDDVVDQIRTSLPTLQTFDTTWSDVEVTVLSEDLALVSMTFRDDVVDAAGTAVHQWGANTFLWKRMAGAWKLIYVDADHYAAPPPDAAAAGSAS